MRNKLGSLNIYIELGKRLGLLLLICVPTVILIWPTSGARWYVWIWIILVIVTVSFLFRFLGLSVPHCVEDVIEGQTELTGSVTKHWHSEVQSSPSGPTSRYYNVQVGEVSFGISRQIYHWLSEGDEVCVTYWPRTKVVRRVDMVKAAPELTKAIRGKKLSEEAVASMKSKYKQDAEEMQRQRALGKTKNHRR